SRTTTARRFRWMSSANAVGNARRCLRRQNLFDGLFGVQRGAPGDARVLSASVAVENERQRVADSVDAERAAGQKCERCWKYAPGFDGGELREILGSSHAA